MQQVFMTLLLDWKGCMVGVYPVPVLLRLAFAYDPDGYWVEIIKRGENHNIKTLYNLSQTMLRVKVSFLSFSCFSKFCNWDYAVLGTSRFRRKHSFCLRNILWSYNCKAHSNGARQRCQGTLMLFLFQKCFPSHPNFPSMFFPSFVVTKLAWREQQQAPVVVLEADGGRVLWCWRIHTHTQTPWRRKNETPVEKWMALVITLFIRRSSMIRPDCFIKDSTSLLNYFLESDCLLL